MRAARLAVLTCVAAAVLVVGMELVARQILGLGDPPLTIRDPDIDYLFAPSRSYIRFGNHIHYNAFSMRSDDNSATKIDPTELRILVMGDSIVNGGALTDDRDLATRILQEKLSERLARPVWVGNVSAGSWGPGNLLAYVRKFGTFDADIALLVVSSHDIADVPDFVADLGPSFPTQPPALALQELIVRYGIQYLAKWLPLAAPTAADAQPASLEQGRQLFVTLLEDLVNRIHAVVVLHHPEQAELADRPTPLAEQMRALGEMLESDAVKFGVPVIQLAPYLARAPQGESPYRDAIHLNNLGQRLYAEAFECASLRVLGRAGTGCA